MESNGSKASRRVMDALRTVSFPTSRCVIVTSLACAAMACGTPATLTQLMDARRQAATLTAHFATAAGAANRAVMVDADDEAAAAVRDARLSRQTVHQDAAVLRALLQNLRFSQELGYLDGFTAAFHQYERTDDEILALAVENSNVKAQRLSFGAAGDASDAFATALDAAVQSAGPRDYPRAEMLALRARVAVLEVRTLFAPHIAESDDAAMTQMEARMAASDRSARQALVDLRAMLPPTGVDRLAAASAALDRLLSVQAEIITLSRRNSDVQSIALSLGKKRTLTARCQDQLQLLEKALAGRGSSAATR